MQSEPGSMTDHIIPVNNEALSRALIAVVGVATTKTIVEAYQAIDSAMAYGFARGTAAAAEASKMQAQEYVEALQRSEARDTEEAFEAGKFEGHKMGFDQATVDTIKAINAAYSRGYLEAEWAYRRQDEADKAQNEQAHYDDGYVDGVSAARCCPAEADRYVAKLCSEDEAETFDNYDDFAEAYQGDSGDEAHDWRDQFDPMHPNFRDFDHAPSEMNPDPDALKATF